MTDLYIILFAALTILLIYVVKKFEYDILEPSIIFLTTMTFSVLMSMIVSEKWAFTIEINTCILIILSMVAFILGDLFIYKSFGKKIKIDVKKNYFYINDAKLIAIFFIMIIMAAFSIKESYEMSVNLGNTSGISEMIRINRQAIEAKTATLSKFMNYRSMIAQVLAYSCFFVFIYNFINFKIKKYRLLIPILLYIPFLILNTGRMILITLIIYIFIILGIIYQKKCGYDLKSKIFTLKMLIISGITFIILFLVMGIFTGKTISEERTPLIILAHYAGVSIPAFDYFVNQIQTETLYIGSHTLHGIYRAFNSLGINLPEVPLFLPFVRFNSIDTNVYTAEARYIRDYGIIGTFAILWILGAFYSYLYNFLKTRENFLILMIYGYLAYPLFLSSIDERFLMDFASTTPVYMIILFIFAKKILIEWRKFEE